MQSKTARHSLWKSAERFFQIFRLIKKEVYLDNVIYAIMLIILLRSLFIMVSDMLQVLYQLVKIDLLP
jgi:hypothetical protein